MHDKKKTHWNLRVDTQYTAAPHSETNKPETFKQRKAKIRYMLISWLMNIMYVVYRQH